MANSEILEALNSLRTHLESQFTATNSTIKACTQLVDFKFTDLLSTSPSPAEAPTSASSPVFRSGGSSSAPQQRCLLTAPVQPPGSSNSGISIPSFDVTSAAASTSFSAAPPLFLSTTLYQTTNNANGKLRIIDDKGGKVALGSCISGSPLDSTFSKSVKQAPQAASGVNLTALFEKAGCKTFASLHRFRSLPPPPPPFFPLIEATLISTVRPPSASPFPTKAALSCNKIVLGDNSSGGYGGISFSQFQVLAHSIWPSPTDTKAQSLLNLESNQKEATVNSLGKKDIFGHGWKDVLFGIFRRLVIFNLYALKEVYKDSLESPP